MAKKIVEQDGWISVDKELPEIDEEVLVFYTYRMFGETHRGLNIARRIGYWSVDEDSLNEFFWDLEIKRADNRVIFWMKPPPYPDLKENMI